MIRAEDFRRAMRGGAHAASENLVVHYLADEDLGTHPLVGFVVPKKEIALATGRARVKRRLRHLGALYLPELPPGSLSVVRARKGCERLDGERLSGELRGTWARAQRRYANRQEANGAIVGQREPGQ